MTVLFANLAGATLAAAITNSATAIALSAGEGALFPSPTTDQWFPLVLQAASNPATYEIVRATARSGDTLTIVRAQEGTTALSFNAGDLAQNRVTMASLEGLQVVFAIDSGSVNGVVVNLVPTPAALSNVIGVPFVVQKIGSANTGAMTLNPNGLGAVLLSYADGRNFTAGQWPASAMALVVYDGTAFRAITLPSLSVQFQSSLGTSGWKMYPDPNSASGYTLEQWGIGNLTAASATVTFPIPFPTSCRGVTLCERNAGGGWATGDATLYGASGASTTGFTLYGWIVSPTGALVAPTGPTGIGYYYEAKGW